MPKGFRTNAGPKSKAKNLLDAVTPDPFGDKPKDALAIDWNSVLPANLVTIISRVCHAGGYVSFSAAPGGEAIKFSLSIGGSAGYRWAHSGKELAGYLAVALGAIQDFERRVRDMEELVRQPNEPSVKEDKSP